MSNSPAELLDTFEQAQRVYDEALRGAYNRSKELEGAKYRPWTEEMVKLVAREAVRKAGYDSLETLRWRLRAVLGSIGGTPSE